VAHGPKTAALLELTMCCPPPRFRVNRTYFRFGRYRNPRRPHPPPRASRVTVTHPRSAASPSLALTHRHPLDQSTRPTRVHFGPRPAQPKWAHTTVSLPGCTAREGKSALNATLNWALPPPTPAFHLLFHRPLSPFTVNRGRPPSYLLL
jgi:hypothetical protein